MKEIANDTANNRTGVILAAGLGSRLAGATGFDGPKPLIPVGGTPLIVRAVAGLERAGCDWVVIVLGFQGEHIERVVKQHYQGPAELIFAHNPRYELANGMSVLAARDWVEGEFVLTMADHIFDPTVLELVRDVRPPPNGAALLVDYKLDTIFDMDDATKVLVKDGRITRIGKELASFNAVDTGLFVCTGALFGALEKVYAQHGDVSLSDGVQALCAADEMTGIDIGEGAWQDVDDPEMLERAEMVFGK